MAPCPVHPLPMPHDNRVPKDKGRCLQWMLPRKKACNQINVHDNCSVQQRDHDVAQHFLCKTRF